MSKSRRFQFLFGLILSAFLPFSPAHAQNWDTWVVGGGIDGGACSRDAPCKTLHAAYDQTNAGGQINVLGPGEFGALFITKSISIVNDSGGTANTCCTNTGNESQLAQIVIAAGADGAVTLRGLVFNGSNLAGIPLPVSGVMINNARQVNIQNCVILSQKSPGIIVAPTTDSLSQTLASSMNVEVLDTTVNGSGTGIKITSVPGLPISVAIDRTQIKNNTGAGVRADGTSGGPIRVAISDSAISLNSSNGVLALSGPSGNVTVNVTRSVVASNGLYGVQSNQANGGTAIVTVNASSITTNPSGQVGFFGGGSLLTAGNNLLFGAPGTGFSGPIPLQ